MTIDIRPELEMAIQQQMASGAFRDVNELLSCALKMMEPVKMDGGAEGKTLLAVLDQFRGLLTDEEADTLFQRDRSLPRSVDLS